MANKITRFVTEVKTELKKVSWPTREELISSTIVVLVSVAIMAVFVGTCDLVFSRLINLLIR
jgi:preprotein translocase subunit SecE